MQTRMQSPVRVLPDALKALTALGKSTADALPHAMRQLIDLRASQINGCSVCVDMHARELKRTGEADERIFAVAAWQDAPYFTDAERAVLALTEAATRLSDRSDPVPDAVWAEVARHFDEKALAAITIEIALINAFNRLNVVTRQLTGPWVTSIDLAYAERH